MNRLKTSGYSIRLCNYSKLEDAPGSWCVEGSNDNFKWMPIDEQRKNYIFVENSDPHFFSCVSPEFFRYIRFRQTDKNVSNGNCLCISNAEFFGIYYSIDE